ncbi:uncharacterized protein LOC126660406 isoform X2 [Mercurialis annua]|uniref:uncharacterized protein LOC126660406 isoform X2 n=1 Tax=Mercurialis annua TaxID=3986 RepID=UPI00215E8991|nr:uncharacterized protein LOC126660406 isoform X2 [Mercurialis annua]
MLSKPSSAHSTPTLLPTVPTSSILSRRNFCRFGCSADRRSRFKVVGQSLGDRWKLGDIDTKAVQERFSLWLSKTQDRFNEVTVPLVKSDHAGKPHPEGVQERFNLWLSKTQDLFNEVTTPLVKSGHAGNPDPGNAFDAPELKEIFIGEQTIDSRTPNGVLSFAAIISIEQFSRMNGLTAYKMQKIFKTLVTEPIFNDARNLVEYCCFRFLSRDSSAIHPCLKEPAFQQLIFITMLAWENPYGKEDVSEKPSLQGKLVGEEAFIRIAPAVSGLADHVTAHNLFRDLAGEEEGISLALWLTYIDELLKVHEGRRSFQIHECPNLLEEQILCIGSSRKRPVLKWENNMAWPGKVILTDRALYFESVSLLGKKESRRFDLSKNGLQVQKTKIGPFGSVLFDSAVSVSSGPGSETWVLEFVDLGSDSRRDVWHAIINEVISLHKFMSEFGPEEGDQSALEAYGAQKGKERAITSAMNSIARLQTLQFMRKLLDDPIKLVQFSYLQKAPYGDIVYQALAVNYWGGIFAKKYTEADYQPAQGARPSNGVQISNHVFDIDGSVYLQKWMRSPSWASNASDNFWKNSSIKQGVVLSKNLVVADAALVQKAALTCREKYQVVEKTQATIDAAMLKGIPSNIDLFKELMLPLTIIAKKFEKLRRWEEPHVTISFLAFSYSIIFRSHKVIDY